MRLNLGLDLNLNELIVLLIMLLMVTLFGIWINGQLNSSESFNINLNNEIEQTAE